MKKILIAGLGNPKKEYERNRHNLGFMVADDLRHRLAFDDFSLWKKEALTTKGTYLGDEIHIVKPFSYMNNSGIPLKNYAKFNNIENESLILIFDDFSLDFGKIRIKKSGSAGGHNGVKSVIEQFNTLDLARIKVGIGPVSQNADVASFVLSDFTAAERKDLQALVEKSAMAVLDCIKDIEFAMNRYNG